MTEPKTQPTPDEIKASAQELLGYVALYLKSERTRAGLTQDDIATRTAMSRAWVSKTESGNNAALPSLAMYAAAMELQLAFIVAQAEAAMEAFQSGYERRRTGD